MTDYSLKRQIKKSDNLNFQDVDFYDDEIDGE
jgi:hypothetical protein